MRSKVLIATLLVTLLAGMATACAKPPAGKELAGAAVSATDQVSVSGLATAQSLTRDMLAGLETTQAVIPIMREGGTETYTGVPVAALFSVLGVDPEATSLIFSNANGDRFTFSVDQVTKNANNFILCPSDKGFSLVVSTESASFVVQGINSIEFTK